MSLLPLRGTLCQGGWRSGRNLGKTTPIDDVCSAEEVHRGCAGAGTGCGAAPDSLSAAGWSPLIEYVAWPKREVSLFEVSFTTSCAGSCTEGLPSLPLQSCTEGLPSQLR